MYVTDIRIDSARSHDLAAHPHHQRTPRPARHTNIAAGLGWAARNYTRYTLTKPARAQRLTLPRLWSAAAASTSPGPRAVDRPMSLGQRTNKSY